MTDEIRKQIDGLNRHRVLLTKVLPTGFSQNYSADVVELSDVISLIESIPNLNQLADDSFASANRRCNGLNSLKQIAKIYDELFELEKARLNGLASIHCPELTHVEEEFADVVLACLVFAKCENIDIDKALRVKNEFNKTRK